MILQSIKDVHRKKMNRLMDKLRVVFHKKKLGIKWSLLTVKIS